MEARNESLTLDQAQDILENSTSFKAKFMEEIIGGMACSGSRIDLSGAACQGWYLIMEEIRKDIDQTIEAICHAPKAETSVEN